MTDKALERVTSNTNPLAFPEYLIFNSFNVHFMYIKLNAP